MNRPPSRDDIDRFRGVIARRLGLFFDESKSDYLADIANERIDKRGRGADFRSYLALLDTSEGREEVRALADLLTVSETYFFRYADHFRAFAEEVLPDRMKARDTDRRLRILSAGCASGEEPYSLAMLLRERLGADAGTWDIRIHAVDVSPAAIQKARRARYSTWSLRETPLEMRHNYFQSEGRDFALDRSILEMVTFEERNLIEEDPLFWRPGTYDAAFCRNVTMYFVPDVTRAVIGRVERSLAPGGYLFLGHAETLRGISHEFHLRHTHDTFYYQRRDPAEIRPPAIPPGPAVSAISPIALTPDLLPLDAPWVDAIRQASERIAALTSGSWKSDSPEAPAGHDPIRNPLDLGRTIDLLRQERFSEAMESLRALPPETTANPDAQLLKAVILANAGRIKDAERVGKELLLADELNAGAHYVVALCREHDRDLPGALSHDQTAIYLDAAFAMPHLHWGLMARRTGDTGTARRELAQAADLLGREDASRVLLFGGGFSRDALVELCRAELKACGGRP